MRRWYRSAFRVPSSDLEEATPSNETDPSRPCGAVGAHHSVKMEARVQFPSRALLETRKCEVGIRKFEHDSKGLWFRVPSSAINRGTVRQLAERPSSNLGECGFNSHPCYLKF